MTSTTNQVTRAIIALALTATTGSALAHSGLHAAGASAAFMHPFSGLDHVLAMLAVGVWASSGQPLARGLPYAFVAGALTGVLGAALGIALPGLEGMLAISVLMLGLLLAGTRKLTGGSALGLAAVVGVAHGNAHGNEVAGLLALAPLAAFVAGTALLQGVGYIAGLGLRERAPAVLRMAGTTVAICGGWLLVA